MIGLIGCAWAAFDTPALAQTAPLICPKSGMTMHASDGTVFTASGGTPPVCVFRVRSTGAEFRRFAVFLSDGSEFQRKCGAGVLALWPLAPGNKSRCTSSGASDGGGYDGTWFHTYTVKRAETVTLPAGTLATFLVVLRQEGAHAGSYRDELRYWYAPSVGHLVKADWQMISGTPPSRPPGKWHAIKIENL